METFNNTTILDLNQSIFIYIYPQLISSELAESA
jgi:hypothetical protein